MAASGSNGDTADGRDQWWTTNGGWWHHPTYGSYQQHDNDWNYGKGKGYGNSKGKWNYYAYGNSWGGQGSGADAWSGDANKQNVWNGDAEVEDGGTGGLSSKPAVRSMPKGATPKKKAKSSADGDDEAATTGACIPFSAVDRLANQAIELDSDMQGSLEEIDAAWEGETEAVVMAKQLFWVPEKESRLRNAALTCFEKHQLLKSYPLLVEDMKKVIAMFGEYKGPTRAARALLKHIAGAKSMVPGQMAEYDTPEFSLCKHLLLASWQGYHKDVATSGFEKCLCFPCTSLMVMGCRHKKKSLWRVPFYMETFCLDCSTCMRCGGLLGFITHQVQLIK